MNVLYCNRAAPKSRFAVFFRRIEAVRAWTLGGLVFDQSALAAKERADPRRVPVRAHRIAVLELRPKVVLCSVTDTHRFNLREIHSTRYARHPVTR